MAIGDYIQRHDHVQARTGKPISPRTKSHVLMATRTFFRDCQEWEWFPRRFDPARALAVPRSVSALIGTNPRVIADEVWAKLMWAGLNLEAADLPGYADSYYPMQLIRAVTLTWLFSGLRSDEISRLRVGCIRWQHDGQPIDGDRADVLAEDAVCLLDLPVHKTGTAFTRPVDPIVGQAIEAWRAVHPWVAGTTSFCWRVLMPVRELDGHLGCYLLPNLPPLHRPARHTAARSTRQPRASPTPSWHLKTAGRADTYTHRSSSGRRPSATGEPPAPALARPLDIARRATYNDKSCSLSEIKLAKNSTLPVLSD
jgi:integrase